MGIISSDKLISHSYLKVVNNWLIGRFDWLLLVKDCRSSPPPTQFSHFLNHLTPALFIQQQLVGEFFLTSHPDRPQDIRWWLLTILCVCSALGGGWKDAPHHAIQYGWQAHSIQFRLAGGHSAKVRCLFLTIQQFCQWVPGFLFRPLCLLGGRAWVTIPSSQWPPISNEIGSRNCCSNPTLLVHRSTQEWPFYPLDYQQKEALQFLWVWRDWRRLFFTLLPPNLPLRDSACLQFYLCAKPSCPYTFCSRPIGHRNCCLPPRSQIKPLVPLISASPHPTFYPLPPRSHILSNSFTLPSASLILAQAAPLGWHPPPNQVQLWILPDVLILPILSLLFTVNLFHHT